MLRVILVLACAAALASAFTTTSRCTRAGSQQLSHVQSKKQRRIGLSLRMSTKRQNGRLEDDDDERWVHPCPEPEDDVDLDRREAAFATLGALWATTGVGTSILFPESAQAVYGSDAKIELPNPYQQLADRASKQCMVESLGNRECLVYAEDAASFLYQGADNQALLERIEKASTALATIPAMNDSRKWSQITGVLTGPCGELIRTMGQIADLSENSDAAKKLVATTKKDLYAMQDGVGKKDQSLVSKYHTAATNDLVAFVKAL